MIDKMKILIPFIVIVIIVVSCNTSFEPANSQIPYGIWVYSRNHDSIHIYSSAKKFERNKPGFAVKKNNVFIERTSGWCGTPPLSYFNVEGKWKSIDENTIEIISQYWSNEKYTRTMKIVSLSGHTLKIIFRQ